MGIIKFFKNLTKSKPSSRLDELQLKVLEAKEDWQIAQKMCNEITDPKHLDNAILKVARAERKYIHYLTLIKAATGKGKN